MRTHYLPIATVRGVPVLMHWTTPVAVAALGWLHGGHLLAGWSWLTVAALIVIHVLGHGVVARAHGVRLVELRLHGLGGSALTGATRDRRARTLVAWGGCIAQGVVAMGLLLPLLAGPGADSALGPTAAVNGLMLLANLLPLPGMDGKRGWSLLAAAAPTVGPASTDDPLAVPGLDARIRESARRIGQVTGHRGSPAGREGAAPAEVALPADMPRDIVAAADSLMDEIRRSRRRPGATDDAGDAETDGSAGDAETDGAPDGAR